MDIHINAENELFSDAHLIEQGEQQPRVSPLPSFLPAVLRQRPVSRRIHLCAESLDSLTLHATDLVQKLPRRFQEPRPAQHRGVTSERPELRRPGLRGEREGEALILDLVAGDRDRRTPRHVHIALVGVGNGGQEGREGIRRVERRLLV